jgi:hypothetical protein
MGTEHRHGALEERRAWIATALLTVGTFVFSEWIALTQWLSGRWYLADVGNIHYCLFNTLHGRFMVSPLMGHLNHFAFHLTPFLILLVPLVPLSAYPVPLVTSYVVALSLCVPAMHLLARRCRVSPAGSVALAWLFFANHFVGSLHLANHFEIFFVLFSLLAMAMRHSLLLFPLALLAMSVKEDATVWIGAWAFLEALLAKDKRFRRRMLLLSGIAVVYAVVAAGTIWFFQHKFGRGALTDYGSRFSNFGFGLDTAVILLLLVVSFAGIPLFAGWRTLLILIPLPMLLAGFPFMRALLYYYSYPFLPLLAYLSCLGYRRVELLARRRHWSYVRVALPFFLLVFGAVEYLLPTRTDGYRRLPFEVTARDRYRFELARTLLPLDAPLALQFGLWGITPHRLDTHLLSPRELRPCDWVFMDLNSPHGLQREEFIAVARQLLDEVRAGKRHAHHTAYDIFIVGPVEKSEAKNP